MRRVKKLNRVLVALSLMLSLGLAPALTVCAQQPAQKQTAPQAKGPAGSGRQVKSEAKEPTEGELLPMSDEEMDKVQGGNPIAIGIGLVSLAVGAYSLYSSRRSHQQLLRACTATRR